MNRDNTTGFAIGLLAGALLGGVFALLYAPKPGRELRHDIHEKAVKVARDVKGKFVKGVKH